MKRILRHPFFYILLLSPVILWGLTLLLPTFDDWTYVTAPYFDDVFNPKRMLPFYNKWRPFDALFGSLVGLNTRLFPTLNHICVYAGHLACTYLVYRFSRKFQFNDFSTNIATLFFFISPAVLGTVLGIDSMNQVYSQLWGLMGLWSYLFYQKRRRIIFWLLCVTIATFTKENGLMWAIIPPVIHHAFIHSDRKELKRGLIAGFCLIFCYLIIRLSLPTDMVDTHSDYFRSGMLKRLQFVATFISYTWLPADYVSIIYPPKRNILIAAVTIILSLPFIYSLFIARFHLIRHKKYITLVICAVIAALPHLLTSYTCMHPYASLSIAAWLVAYILNTCQHKKYVAVAFILYACAACFTDLHHGISAYHSGLNGKHLALQAVEKTGKPVQSAYIININNGETKYSSFCTIPYEAFGWGIAAKYETGYTWPEEMEDTTVTSKKPELIQATVHGKLKAGYDCVWLIDGTNLTVIKSSTH